MNDNELLYLVDHDDNVLAHIPKKEVYEKRYIHRIVHIFIKNKLGKIALQLRSDQCGYCPLHWSTSVGGHVSAEESYKQSAIREMKEELGIQTKLAFLSKDFYLDPDETKPSKFLTTFIASYEGEFSLNPREVRMVNYFSLDEINELYVNGEKFHPELVFLLNKHFGMSL